MCLLFSSIDTSKTRRSLRFNGQKKEEKKEAQMVDPSERQTAAKWHKEDSIAHTVCVRVYTEKDIYICLRQHFDIELIR